MANNYLIEISADKNISFDNIANIRETIKRCSEIVIANSRNIKFITCNVNNNHIKIALKIINTKQISDVYKQQNPKLIISGFVRKFKSTFEKELKIKILWLPRYSLRIIRNDNEYIDLDNE